MAKRWAGEIAPEDFKTRGVDVVLAKPCGRVELEGAIGRAGPGPEGLIVEVEGGADLGEERAPAGGGARAQR